MFTKTAQAFTEKIASLPMMVPAATSSAKKGILGRVAKAGLGLAAGTWLGNKMYQLQNQPQQPTPPGRQLGYGPGYGLGYGQGPYAGMNPEGPQYDPAVVQRFLQMQQEQRSQGFGEAQ